MLLATLRVVIKDRGGASLVCSLAEREAGRKFSWWKEIYQNVILFYIILLDFYYS